MKTHSHLFSGLLSILLLVSGVAFAGGGGVGGSGGDGLILKSPPNHNVVSGGGGVIVPVPKGLQAYSTLNVQGDLVPTLPKDFVAYPCSSESGSCDSSNGQTGVLNIPLSLRPGYYMVCYYTGCIKGNDGKSVIDLTQSKTVSLNIQYATLEIAGNPGRAQKNEFGYGTSIDGDQATFTPVGTAELNQEIILPTGNYLISYSNTYERIELRAGDKRVVNLDWIKVDKVDGSYQYQVFHDESDPSEQKWKLPLKYDFDVLRDYSTVNNVFSGLYVSDAEAKHLAQTGKDYQNSGWSEDFWKKNAPEMVRFNADGSYSELLFDCGPITTYQGVQGLFQRIHWAYTTDSNKSTFCSVKYADPEFNFVTDPNDGDFVSVLPGTYRIQFIAQDGKTTLSDPIKVNGN
jgi:hypothetical protein